MFSKQELSIIGQLIQKADIKGGDAIIVAQLLVKIDNLLKEPVKEPVKEEAK